MARSHGKIHAAIWRDPDHLTTERTLPLGESVLVDFDAIDYHAWRRWPVAEHFVYLLLDADRDLFYVGRTCSVRSRMSAHRGRRGFGNRARFVVLQACESKTAAAALELDLIKQLQPVGNDQHCPPRKRTA